MALGNLAGRLGWAAVSDKIGTVPVIRFGQLDLNPDPH